MRVLKTCGWGVNVDKVSVSIIGRISLLFFESESKYGIVERTSSKKNILIIFRLIKANPPSDPIHGLERTKLCIYLWYIRAK